MFQDVEIEHAESPEELSFYEQLEAGLIKHNKQHGDDNLKVRFLDIPVRSEVLSKQKGKNIFVSKVAVEVTIPPLRAGGKPEVVNTFIDEEDVFEGNRQAWVTRFPKQWSQYLAEKKHGKVNTELHLQNFTFIPELVRVNLLASNVVRLDQLAMLSDDQLKKLKIEEYKEYRDKAKRHLEIAEKLKKEFGDEEFTIKDISNIESLSKKKK